jgi:hypothetical protein
MNNRTRKTVLLLMAGLLLFLLVPTAGAQGAGTEDWRYETHHATVYNPDKDEYFQVFVHQPVPQQFANLQSRRFDRHGIPFGYDVTHSNAGGMIDRILTAYDSANGRYLVVWQSGNSMIDFGYVNADDPGHFVSAGFQTVCLACSQPSLAVDPGTGRFAVSYFDQSGNRLAVSYFLPSGDAYERHELTVTDLDEGGQVLDTAIGHVSGNRYFIAWNQAYELIAGIFGTFVEFAPEEESYALIQDEAVSFGYGMYRPGNLALDAGATDAVVFWQSGQDDERDTYTVAKAVYGSVEPFSLAIDFHRMDDVYDGFSTFDITRTTLGDYAVLLGRKFGMNNEAYTDLYGFRVFSELDGFTPPDLLAESMEYGGFHQVYNANEGTVYYFYHSRFGTRLLPFGVPYMHPPAFVQPKLSLDPATGNYLMLSRNEDNVNVHLFGRKPDAVELRRIGTLNGDGEFVYDYDAAYADDAYLAVWLSVDDGQQTHLSGRYFAAGQPEEGSPDFSVETETSTQHVQLLHDDLSGQFIVFHTIFVQGGDVLHARTIDGNAVGAPIPLFDLGFGYADLNIVKLEDGLLAAVWLDGEGRASVRTLQIVTDDNGEFDTIEPYGPLQSQLLSDNSDIQTLRVAPFGTGSQLIIAGYSPSHDAIALWSAALDGEQWYVDHLSDVDADMEAMEGTYLDFDVYAGEYTDHEPVVAWLWRGADDAMKYTIHYTERENTLLIWLDSPYVAHYGTLRLLPGKNMLNLFAEGHMEWPTADVGTGFFTLAMDFESELRAFTRGEPIAITDIVKYSRQLDVNLFGYALDQAGGLAGLLERIDPVVPQP